MKKMTAGLGVAAVTALSTVGLVGPAHADYPDNGTDDSDVAPSSIDSNAAAGNNSGVLPSTGGPETALLVGGAALLAVGGTALVVARRRGNSNS